MMSENLANQGGVPCHYEQETGKRERKSKGGGGTNLANTTYENQSICLKRRKKNLRGISRPLNVIINIG